VEGFAICADAGGSMSGSTAKFQRMKVTSDTEQADFLSRVKDALHPGA
jgi:hypothetical protein